MLTAATGFTSLPMSSGLPASAKAFAAPVHPSGESPSITAWDPGDHSLKIQVHGSNFNEDGDYTIKVAHPSTGQVTTTAIRDGVPDGNFWTIDAGYQKPTGPIMLVAVWHAGHVVASVQISTQ